MLTGVEIAKPFVKATLDILQTMAGITATAGAPYVKKDLLAKGEISAIVGVTGDKRGTIAVSFTRACAISLVKGMLGDDIHDVIQDTQDAVGEMSNMISGQARAHLAGQGLALQGSTPSVIMGEKHTIRHTANSPVMVIPFTSPGGEFTVEFCFE